MEEKFLFGYTVHVEDFIHHLADEYLWDFLPDKWRGNRRVLGQHDMAPTNCTENLFS